MTDFNLQPPSARLLHLPAGEDYNQDTMPIDLGNLPTWAVLILVFLAAAVLVLLNIGWLIAARGLLEQTRRRREEREQKRREER